MLSSLSGLADRNFVVGFLLPTLIAAVLLTWLFQGYAFVAPIWETLRSADGFASLTLFVLAVWCAAVLLAVFNVQLYRILEGYYGPLSGKRRIERYKRKFAAEQTRFIALAKDVDEGRYERGRYFGVYAKSQLNYPLKAEYVKPSRFGNILSSIETYPLEHYGADGATLWPRLLSVVPESYQRLIDSARAEVDFFVSGLFLSLLLCCVCLWSFLWSLYADWRDSSGFMWLHLIASIAFALAAVLAYEGALIRARGWGHAVRSAYDLFLSGLGKQLGYEEPAEAAARKQFWIAFSSMVAYALPIDGRYRVAPRLPPASSKPRRSPDTV